MKHSIFQSCVINLNVRKQVIFFCLVTCDYRKIFIYYCFNLQIHKAGVSKQEYHTISKDPLVPFVLLLNYTNLNYIKIRHIIPENKVHAVCIKGGNKVVKIVLSSHSQYIYLYCHPLYIGGTAASRNIFVLRSTEPAVYKFSV